MDREIIEIEKWISPYKWEFYYDKKSGAMAIDGIPFEDQEQKQIHFSTMIDKVKKISFYIYDIIGELKEKEFKHLNDFIKFAINILVEFDKEYVEKLFKEVDKYERSKN